MTRPRYSSFLLYGCIAIILGYSIKSAAFCISSISTGRKPLHRSRKKSFSINCCFPPLRGGTSQTSFRNTKGTTLFESNATPTTKPLSEAYYLIWSRGFAKKFGVAATILLFFRLSRLDDGLMQHILSKGLASPTFVMPRFLSDIIFPLLSSSCCAIQLAINTASAVMGASIGCAGFNTVLGPVRPYLLATLLAYTPMTGIGAQSTVISLTIRYFITFLPEVIFLWNGILRSSWRTQERSKNEETKAITNNTVTTNDSEDIIKATLVVDVPTMGCVACINKIESSLRQCAPDNIDAATSWLNSSEKETKKKGGIVKVEIYASSRDKLDEVTQSAIDAVERAGFGGSKILSLDVSEN